MIKIGLPERDYRVVPEEQSFGKGSAPAAMIVAPSQIPNKRMENVANASEICFHGKAEIKQEYFDELSVGGLASCIRPILERSTPGHYGWFSETEA